ncbi:MAG TPA: YkgJ family cysteine cluster protein [Candidatus Thalassarchaeaceae archaeon]|nr:YkgJ family cysteine cluster protein [Candidatus Thalassarchaeaceae archaeon]HJM67281.1 YkgJ family cysteine cluster protein [Candidatus Thalassarchaeaceae archaeon]
MGAWSTTPCLEKGCSFCCRKTEMPLSPSDVLRVATTTGQHPDQFSKEESGIRILLNNSVTEACVFLDTESADPQAPGLCSIYENRPIGCRTYPLILNEEDEAFLDSLCPYREEFPEIPPALLMMLKRLDSELQGQS